MISQRLSINHGVEVRRADGYLIYACRIPSDAWPEYETWRSEVCHRNRDKNLWLAFREGRFNLKILLYAAFLKLTRR